MSDTRKCSGPTCNATMRFVKIETYDSKSKGMVMKPRPIDLAPSDTGNVVVLGDVARVLPKDEAARLRAAGNSLYTLHHATCPDAAWFRARAAEKRDRP